MKKSNNKRVEKILFLAAIMLISFQLSAKVSPIASSKISDDSKGVTEWNQLSPMGCLAEGDFLKASAKVYSKQQCYFYTQSGTYAIADKVKEVEIPKVDAKSDKFQFCHDQTVEISFKTNNQLCDKSFMWSLASGDYSCLMFDYAEQYSNSLKFIAQNITNSPKQVDINVTPVYTSGQIKHLGEPATITITIHPLVKPTFVEKPQKFAANDFSPVTYKTQANKDQYQWFFDGEEDVDYTLISGGTEHDNEAKVVWLTKGKKTVKTRFYSKDEFVSSEDYASATVQVNKLGQELKVGDHYQGGTIFKVFGTPGRQYGYIVADQELSETIWSDAVDFEDASFYSNGAENTKLIVKRSKDETSAATLCNNFTAQDNGVIFSDWYLPATAQLMNIQKDLPSKLSGVYWSSTQCKTARYNALAVTDQGTIESNKKNSDCILNKVLAIRSFSYENTPIEIETSIEGMLVASVGDAPVELVFQAQGGSAPYTFTYQINDSEKQTITTTRRSSSVSIFVPTDKAANFNVSLLQVQHKGDQFAYAKENQQVGVVVVDENTNNSKPIVMASVVE